MIADFEDSWPQSQILLGGAADLWIFPVVAATGPYIGQLTPPTGMGSFLPGKRGGDSAPPWPILIEA